MTDIKVSTLSVPKIPRNKRIYSDGYQVQRYTVGTPAQSVDTRNHVEGRILSYDAGDFSTREIEIVFGDPFFDTPVGFVKLYRYEPRDEGGVFITDVVSYCEDEDWLTDIGFKVIIEDYESLSGVFMKYFFTEQI